MYECAVQLIKAGTAYVDDLQGDEVSHYRGRWDEPGRDSPFRDRSVEENLDLFARMRTGEFADGSRTLRAKIDMAAPNMNMRDPTIYRIRRAPHYRQGDRWCIYPLYDFTHPLSDAYERVTHSLCTLEFEDHRPLYDWFLEQLDFDDPPQQIEFARLNLTHTLLSKRRLLELVEGGYVDGWDDPGCRRSLECVAGDIRQRPSAISATGSASRRQIAWCRWRNSRTPFARISTVTHRA